MQAGPAWSPPKAHLPHSRWSSSSSCSLPAVLGPYTCTDCPVSPGRIWDCRESCTSQQHLCCQTAREGCLWLLGGLWGITAANPQGELRYQITETCSDRGYVWIVTREDIQRGSGSHPALAVGRLEAAVQNQHKHHHAATTENIFQVTNRKQLKKYGNKALKWDSNRLARSEPQLAQTSLLQGWTVPCGGKRLPRRGRCPRRLLRQHRAWGCIAGPCCSKYCALSGINTTLVHYHP